MKIPAIVKSAVRTVRGVIVTAAMLITVTAPFMYWSLTTRIIRDARAAYVYSCERANDSNANKIGFFTDLLADPRVSAVDRDRVLARARVHFPQKDCSVYPPTPATPSLP